jgi:HlyD family secretion protein
MKKKARILAWVTGAVLLAAAATLVAISRTERTVSGTDQIPLAEVKRGAIHLQVHSTGELQAGHVAVLTAPPVGGDSLQITKLTSTGQHVHKGDIVIEFDPTQQQYKLEQSQSELEQGTQEIIKAKADAAVLAAKDKVALLKAHYDVRKAELDVQKDPLLSTIDGEKNELALKQAKRVLAEEEKDILSHADSGKAAIYLAQQKYDKAKLEMDEAKQNLAKMKVAATMDGLVSLQKNQGAAGGIYFTGMTLPDFHPGDTTNPGTAIAHVIDPMEMKLDSEVNESDRSNVHAGQAVEVTFYSIPGKIFRGTVSNVAGMSSQGIFSMASSEGSFHATIKIANLDPRLRPGLTGDVLFLGESQKNLLYIPRLAIFMKDGKQIVYVKKGSDYDPQPVKILCGNESRAAVDGLQAGDKVALIDPTVPVKNHSAGGNASAGGSL